MSKINALIVFVSCLLVISSCDDKSNLKNNSIPIPTEVRTNMANEAGFESKKEGWKELIHKSAPEDDWKLINASNFDDLIRDRQFKKSNKAIEIFANGNIEGEWFERGSNNQAGNLRVVDFEPEAELIYGISDNGSVWRSNLSGTNWDVLNDGEIFNKRVIKVFEKSPGVRRILASKGKGIWYSDDEGLTWSESAGFLTPTTGGEGINLIRLNDANSTIVYLYNHDPIVGASRNKIAFSIDDGETFTVMQTLSNAGSYFASMSTFKDASIAYVLNRSATLYKFENGALSLVNDNLGINATNYVKIVSSVSATDTNLYILKNKSDLYKSEDAGLTFNLVNSLPESSWDVGIEVSEDNDEFVYFGAVELYRSENGGNSFNTTSNWWEYYDDVVNKIHADIMDIRSFEKNDGTEFTLIANHGGLSISYDHLQTVTNIGLNGLNIGQFYDVVTSPIDSDYIFGGTQDQGYQKTTVGNSSTNSINFEQVISGDYGHMQFSDEGKSLWIQYPGASFSVYDNAITDDFSSGSFNIDGADMPAYDWIVPTAPSANPTDNFIYAAGGNTEGVDGSYIVKLIYNGNNVTTDQIDFDFEAESGTPIAAINASVVDDEKLYVATENGKFYFSDDNGDNWTQSDINNGPNGYWLYGSAIASSKQTSGLVFFGGTGYSNNGFFRSIDGGATFEKAVEGLPSTAIHDLEMSSDELWVFAATDAGPYAYLIEADEWYYLGGISAPIVEFYSVEVVGSSNTVRFGTHGRGIWDFNITSNFASNIEISKNDLSVYPNPVSSNLFYVNANENATLVIYDLNGKIRQTKQVSVGINKIDHNLKNGIYIYAIISSEKVLKTGKLEVMK